MIFYIEDDMHMTKSLVILAFERAWEVTEAATRGVLSKNVFLEISQNSQEKSCARVSFLIKLQVSGVFLWVSRNFLEQLFYRTPLVAASKVIITLWGLINQRNVFEGCSWFKSTNLEVVLNMAMGFLQQCVKRVKTILLKILRTNYYF